MHAAIQDQGRHYRDPLKSNLKLQSSPVNDYEPVMEHNNFNLNPSVNKQEGLGLVNP